MILVVALSWASSLLLLATGAYTPNPGVADGPKRVALSASVTTANPRPVESRDGSLKVVGQTQQPDFDRFAEERSAAKMQVKRTEQSSSPIAGYSRHKRDIHESTSDWYEWPSLLASEVAIRAPNGMYISAARPMLWTSGLTYGVRFHCAKQVDVYEKLFMLRGMWNNDGTYDEYPRDTVTLKSSTQRLSVQDREGPFYFHFEPVYSTTYRIYFVNRHGRKFGPPLRCEGSTKNETTFEVEVISFPERISSVTPWSSTWDRATYRAEHEILYCGKGYLAYDAGYLYPTRYELSFTGGLKPTVLFPRNITGIVNVDGEHLMIGGKLEKRFPNISSIVKVASRVPTLLAVSHVEVVVQFKWKGLMSFSESSAERLVAGFGSATVTTRLIANSRAAGDQLPPRKKCSPFVETLSSVKLPPRRESDVTYKNSVRPRASHARSSKTDNRKGNTRYSSTPNLARP